MSTVERFSPHEKRASSARNKLSANITLLGSFHFDFYKKYYPAERPENSAYGTLLSFGEVEDTIVIACHNDTLSPTDPESYLVKQFDLATGSIRHWNTVGSSQFSGQGDNLTQLLILEDASDSSLTASLKLQSGIGNEWKSSSEEGLIGSSYWVSYQAMHDLKLNEAELLEKILANEAASRALGKSALTSE